MQSVRTSALHLFVISAVLACTGLFPQKSHAAGADRAIASLHVIPVSSFVKLYADTGTGATADVSIWRPNVAPHPGFYMLGDVAMESHDTAPLNTFLVKDQEGVLAKPLGYREVWNDRGSGGDQDVSIWAPYAPQGYICLGAVISQTYEPPSLEAVRCIRSELTQTGQGRKVWDDSKSGAHRDVSLWQSEARDGAGLTPSTFNASPNHAFPRGVDGYRVLDKSKIATFQARRNDDVSSWVRDFSPQVHLASSDAYGPSRVEDFLRHTHSSAGHLVTNEPLMCPSCANPQFLKGQAAEGVPFYAQIVRRVNRQGEETGIVDVIYWMFYAYNEGKRVCIGGQVKSTCLGVWSTFGNHVGDWEHVTIRFEHGFPAKIALSSHSAGSVFDIGDKNIRIVEGGDSLHPVVFSARGSHGLYPRPGEYVYASLPNGSQLVDVTDSGSKWTGSSGLEIFEWQPAGSYPGRLSWMNITDRWGNPKVGCELEFISGECVLNRGPEAPSLKGFAQPSFGGLE
ncbi:Vps62-related protein [Streptomyces erythrochromogenes]|uniref:Vps62-related protein n=1 Tax=Streptomyces erythrochromogenes TaxID=285574 RepID=UPI003689C8C9